MRRTSGPQGRFLVARAGLLGEGGLRPGDWGTAMFREDAAVAKQGHERAQAVRHPGDVELAEHAWQGEVHGVCSLAGSGRASGLPRPLMAKGLAARLTAHTGHLQSFGGSLSCYVNH